MREAVAMEVSRQQVMGLCSCIPDGRPRYSGPPASVEGVPATAAPSTGRTQ